MSSSRPPTPSRLAAPVASAIFEAFVDYRTQFLETTRRARATFEKRDFHQLAADSKARLDLYARGVDRAEQELRVLLGQRIDERLIWVSAKAVYSLLIAERPDWDIAETFFNGASRRVFDTVGVDPLIEFVASDFDSPPCHTENLLRQYGAAAGMRDCLRECLGDFELSVPWARLDADVEEMVGLCQARLGDRKPMSLEVVGTLFYRGHGAYVIGRVVLTNGRVVPLAIALQHEDDGIVVDAVLTEENDISILFSFTHNYFHVDVPGPYAVMRFLRTLIPKKPIAEIYIALGEPKQGKTELYRAMIDHIDDTQERFEYAPGIPGLVMVVFTMPNREMVLKVIRDNFPPEKAVSNEQVRARYEWVYRHDRAGRLVDAQQFEHLVFPKERFEEELLEELTKGCKKSIHIEGDRLVIELAYVNRQLTPLNIYVRREDEEKAKAALAEWGNAIADLARCNIFPGDLLLKNFGVTRHGRVALYDYDELQPLHEMNFREMPEPDEDDDDAMMSSSPHFAVGPRDVFPEEWMNFLGVPPKLKPALCESHGFLFTAAWWKDVQEQVAVGEPVDFIPYRPDRRLPSRTA